MRVTPTPHLLSLSAPCPARLARPHTRVSNAARACSLLAMTSPATKAQHPLIEHGRLAFVFAHVLVHLECGARGSKQGKGGACISRLHRCSRAAGLAPLALVLHASARLSRLLHPSISVGRRRQDKPHRYLHASLVSSTHLHCTFLSIMTRRRQDKPHRYRYDKSGIKASPTGIDMTKAV